jgi:single-strand DNA-binding protein
MANLNKVMLMGNLTRDPQLTYTPNQTPVCEIGLATNRRWTGQDGQPHEEVTFVDCSIFGRRAEVLAKYVTKGQPIFIEGRLKYDQWQAQDGSKRSKLRVVIDNFEFIGGPRNAGAPSEGGEMEAGGGAPAPRPAYQPRQNFRPAGRPAVPAQRPAAPPADAEQHMDQPPPPDDEAPPIRDDDIPF